MTSDTRTYTVTGMSCGHCVLSVRGEVSQVRGVERVDVELGSGTLTVAGAGFSDEDVRGAVEGAGYELAGAAPNAAEA